MTQIRPVRAYLPPDVHEALRRAAFDRKMSLSALIGARMREWLADEEASSAATEAQK